MSRRTKRIPHSLSCRKTTIAALTVPHPSLTPFYTIYAPTAKLEMLVKPMKNKEKYKTPKVSDKMLTSSIEHNIKTRFDNDATKKCISNSNPSRRKPHCLTTLRELHKASNADHTCILLVINLPFKPHFISPSCILPFSPSARSGGMREAVE